jgi:hypothetical protein
MLGMQAEASGEGYSARDLDKISFGNDPIHLLSGDVSVSK